MSLKTVDNITTSIPVIPGYSLSVPVLPGYYRIRVKTAKYIYENREKGVDTDSPCPVVTSTLDKN